MKPDPVPYTALSCLVLLLAASHLSAQPSNPPAGDNPAAGEPSELVTYLGAYFTAPDDRSRARTVRKIERLEGATVSAVQEALGSLELWEARAAGSDRFDVRVPRGRGGVDLSVLASVPPGYDPRLRWPMVVTFPNEGSSAEAALAVARGFLGDRADDFVIVSPMSVPQLWFASPESFAGDVPALMRGLRERYHVDEARVYLLGMGRGGHAAFVTAARYPSEVAGAIVIEGTLAHRWGVTAALAHVSNLAGIPVVATYARPDDAAPADGSVFAWNEYLGKHVYARGWTAFWTYPLDAESDAQIRDLHMSRMAELLASRRDLRRQTSLLFRYQPEGRTDWVRVTRLTGEPWPVEELIVASKPGETRAAAVDAILRENLATLSAVIDGQVIRLDTHHCRAMEVLLNDVLVNLDEDIRIELNGTVRFEGRAERRVETLLEEAHARWQFEQLWPVRFKLTEKARAKQE